MFYCQYCNKEIGNKGSLKRHEISCKSNPNKIYINPNKNRDYSKTKFIAWNKGETKETSLSILKYVNTFKKHLKEGSIIPSFKGKHHTEEFKKRQRQKILKWQEEHKEEFLRYSRGQSTVCENFKKMLRDQNIDFIEEFTPYPEERLYRLDIAFPDEKIGIEINGSQHYNKNGDLNHATLEKQKFFEEHGWKIFQIHYRRCFSIKIEDFQDILSLPIHDKEYVKDSMNIRSKFDLYQEKYQKILKDLIDNSNIDFSKFGWLDKAKTYIQEKYGYCPKMLKRIISKYYPEFFEIVNPFTRKSI